jgi:hypothetical protein
MSDETLEVNNITILIHIRIPAGVAYLFVGEVQSYSDRNHPL